MVKQTESNLTPFRSFQMQRSVASIGRALANAGRTVAVTAHRRGGESRGLRFAQQRVSSSSGKKRRFHGPTILSATLRAQLSLQK